MTDIGSSGLLLFYKVFNVYLYRRLHLMVVKQSIVLIHVHTKMAISCEC